MRTIEVSAKTRELAIKDALQQLGVERDEVHVEIIDEGSAGLFGFGARNVKLRVSTDVGAAEPERHRHAQRDQHHGRTQRHDHPRHEQAPRQQQPRENREPRQPQQQPRGQHPQRQQQPQREPRDAREHREQREHREPRPPREPREQRGPQHEQQPRPEPAPRPEPRERKPPAPPKVFNGPPDTEVEALVREVVQLMGIEATITSATGEGNAVSIKIESPDSAILIGRKGRALESLQYLVNRMMPKVEGEDGDRVTIDIEGYLDRRQEALEELAHRLADRARESGRRQRTKPMGSQERRVIHMTLEGDDSIRTFSVGDAGDRHVVIAPKDERGGGDRPQRGRGGFRGDRGPRDRGGEERDVRQPHKPRGLFTDRSRPADGAPDDADQPREGNGNGAPRRRRRSRRGGRGRGPRPEAPAAQGDTVESGSQES
ncbi:MAG: Jag N-terminal domain-containing protein [Candidatus Hydrogenedentes bacterium]|nr:Jag N-terminal domain-containing protein [Candidatus Hydrogenedentota bacterium]